MGKGSNDRVLGASEKVVRVGIGAVCANAVDVFHGTSDRVDLDLDFGKA